MQDAAGFDDDIVIGILPGETVERSKRPEQLAAVHQVRRLPMLSQGPQRPELKPFKLHRIYTPPPPPSAESIAHEVLRLAFELGWLPAGKKETRKKADRAPAPRRPFDSKQGRHAAMYQELLKLEGFNLKEWLFDHRREFSRTTFNDYRRGRIAGRVSAPKRELIEGAIRREYDTRTRTHSH